MKLFYRVADVGHGHGSGVVIDALELWCVDHIVVGGLTGANAVIDVVECNHSLLGFRRQTERRVGRHSLFAGAQNWRLATVL